MKRKKSIVSIFLIIAFTINFYQIFVGARENWNSGAKINYVPATYDKTYDVPDWMYGNLDDLGIEAYEDLYENNLKWNIFVGPLRAYQNYLKTNNLQTLTSNGSSISNFKDSENLEPYTAKSEAEILIRLGVLTGVKEDDGMYMYMENYVKRGEVAKILAVFYQKLFPGIEPIRGINNFEDTYDHWAKQYIDYCYERGLLDGKSNNSFDPEGYMTKAESIRLLCNMANGYTVIEARNVAKAINETYKCTTAYDEENNSNQNSNQYQGKSLMIPDKWYYTVSQNASVNVEVKSSNSSRTLNFRALSGNIKITNTNLKSGKYVVNVRGIYEGTGIIECKYSSASSEYDTLYIPVFVKGYNTVKATNINTRTTSIPLNVGEQYFLSKDISIVPNSATYNGVYFSSTDPSIASVNYLTGQITARNTGSCYIYVMTYNMSKKISVKVSGYNYNYPNNSNLNLTVQVGRTLDLKNYNYFTSYNVSYYSNNSTIASVTSNGIVTGRKIGNTQIIISNSYNQRTIVNIYVQGNYNNYEYDVERVDLRYNSINVGIDDEYEMYTNLYIYPSNADTSSLRFSSEDTSIAKVSRKDGIVTGISRGITRIKIYNNNFSVYCTVYVGYEGGSDITNIEVNLPNNQLLLNVGEVYYLSNNISVYPSNIENYKVYYSSDNTNVARIDSNGKITAYTYGNATITVRVGNIVKYVYVNVNNTQVTPTTPPTMEPIPTQQPAPNPTIKNVEFLNKEVIYLGVGMDFNPYSILNLTSGVNFVVSDYTKAKVENGRVIGISEGSITLTANYNGSSDTIQIVITK